MATTCPQQRITLKIKHPNPLFEKWLTEWRREAHAKGSKMEHVFQIALMSLKKYPLPLASGKDCGILHGFGTKLCQMLDQRLQDHLANPVVVQPSASPPKKSPKTSNPKPAKKTNTSDKKYIPQPKSGPHALLVTLFQESQTKDYPGFLSKSELCRKAEAFSDKSFTKPDPGCRYTAWSSMKTLLTKNLVSKTGNPAKFSLTNEGTELASHLLQINSENSENISEKSSQFLKTIPLKVNDQICREISENETEESDFQSQSQFDDIIFKPKSFQIILLVDNQETEGKKRQLNDATIQELQHQKLAHEVRNLKVGDFTWICRDNQNRELILPYIVERKRMDDLGASIKDGRFHEQKFRLKQCGVQNVIYLVESHGNNQHTGLPLDTLYQAVTNTWVQDGFNVKFTSNHKNSIAYLATLTKILKDIFWGKTLTGCSKEQLIPSSVSDEVVPLMVFSDFNKEASKTKDLSVKELFLTHLLQLKGVSLEKAEAIVNRFPSPKHLLNAYETSSSKEGENLLSTIPYGAARQNVGSVISRTIYQLYTKSVL